MSLQLTTGVTLFSVSAMAGAKSVAWSHFTGHFTATFSALTRPSLGTSTVVPYTAE